MGKGLCYFPPTHCKPIFSRLVVGAKLTANIAHIPQSTMNFIEIFCVKFLNANLLLCDANFKILCCKTFCRYKNTIYICPRNLRKGFIASKEFRDIN